MKLKNILVPVDFSECSNNALEYAIELAALSEAKLTLLHCYVVHIPAAEITTDLQPELAHEYRQTAERNFKLLKERLQSLSKVDFQEEIKISFINDGIANTAKEIEADLIVMGTRGADNRIDNFFGSNTYRTIKKSKLPVLAIPEEATFKPLKKILFAADFKFVADLKNLEIIKTLSTLFNAKIEILHVGHGWSELNMHQTEEASAIVEFFGHTDHAYHFIKDNAPIESTIDNHISEHQNELLVLIARKHHFPGSLFKKKITRRTVMHTELPLLTIPDIK
ncbi:hypothetical protein BFP97_05540 [Roseivirga sp. 4D4]|uniref:universal stress protein n=1 Tax=Roseivirga sp. 4D4 TaxID=1889784 RepID=UPI000852F0C8|nr:universal stress protein [Roseivirga sp. 4D4]OEK01006.1 hypothetical protein BFP97_05540 [Roseivirga sp. 4D4]